MDLDKVKTMSNKDLRIKAAELVGFTDIRLRFVPVPWLMDLVEKELSGYLDGEIRCIPDYPNDIAAAMQLWNAAIEKCDGFPCWELRTCLNGERGAWATFRFASHKYFSYNDREVVGIAGRGEEARAITHVYILAMMREGEK